MKAMYIFFLLIFNVTAFCQEPVDVYNAASIKQDLLKDAHTVKRFEKVEMDINGPDRIGMHSREVVTIMNEKGSNELVFYMYTSRSLSLDDVDIRLYNKSGLLIEKYKKKDLSSQAAGSGLVEDGTIYFIKLSTASYPVTIEKDYTVHFRGVIQIPSFYFSQPNQSVEYSTLLLKYPSSIKVNYKAFHFTEKPVKQINNANEVVQFTATSLIAKKYEENSGPWNHEFPHILFNADKINFDGYAGNLSTWKDMGLWYNSLVKNTNKLSDNYQDEIRKMVIGATSDKEKAKIIYQYLQQNFRYVSIQLGIGGFKPFPANFVHEKKYGDCKGLSNYMEACLAAVNIRSYSAWIKSGIDDVLIDPDFAHDGFDHQILMVPFEKDTVWLECTSNYNEFGHLGSFTENRYALVLTETGGRLIKTPASRYEDNSLTTYTDVKITTEGSAELKSRVLARGELKYLLVNVSRETAEIHKEYAVNYFGISNPDKFNMSFGSKENVEYPVLIQMEVDKIYDFKAGSKMFIKPRIFKLWKQKLNSVETRTQNFYLSYPMTKTDTTAYHLPEGYIPESIPKDRQLSYAQGSYRSTYWYDDKSRTIYTAASLTLTNFTVDPSQYNEARIFFDQVMEDGNQKIICKSAD